MFHSQGFLESREGVNMCGGTVIVLLKKYFEQFINIHGQNNIEQVVQVVGVVYIE